MFKGWDVTIYIWDRNTTFLKQTIIENVFRNNKRLQTIRSTYKAHYFKNFVFFNSTLLLK